MITRNECEFGGYVASMNYYPDKGKERLTISLAEDYRLYQDDGDKKDKKDRRYTNDTRYHDFVAFGVIAQAVHAKAKKAKSALIKGELGYRKRLVIINGKEVSLKTPNLRIKSIDGFNIVDWKPEEEEKKNKYEQPEEVDLGDLPV